MPTKVLKLGGGGGGGRRGGGREREREVAREGEIDTKEKKREWEEGERESVGGGDLFYFIKEGNGISNS